MLATAVLHGCRGGLTRHGKWSAEALAAGSRTSLCAAAATGFSTIAAAAAAAKPLLSPETAVSEPTPASSFGSARMSVSYRDNIASDHMARR